MSARAAFHPLTVCHLARLAEDAVAISLAVPPELRGRFAFRAGQHVTVRRRGADDPVRRSYSICSTPAELAARGVLRIGVRHIAGGAFSGYAVDGLAVGDEVDVLPPTGHFTTAFDPARTRHYAAVAAGSGITPVLSLIATALATEPGSRFTLLFGNRRAATVMFADELGDLKDRWPDRLHLVHVLSRETQAAPLLSGRLDAERLRAILAAGLVPGAEVDEWFLCGPYELVEQARPVLVEAGVAPGIIHTELFHVEGEPVTPRAVPDDDRPAVTLTFRLDGRESTVGVFGGERLLDAALRARADLPYACRGGVCSTCRARLVTGEVTMARSYALTADDVAAGYVLTCQATPETAHVVVDYDS
jgi:ring-1,2-phenylacetyl-CoA epoxidase subunit PaaE